MQELIKLNKARQALIEAKNLDEIQDILDKSIAFQAYAKAAKMGIEMQNECAEIKIRAERKAGEFLNDIPREHGKRTDTSLQSATRLQEAEVEKTQAHRWQKIASVPKAEFEKHIQDTKNKKDELTSASLIKIANQINTHNPIPVKSIPKEKYDLIYCDPPWRYEFPVSNSRKIENQYSTLSLDEIKNLIVPAADNCVLLMWATAPKLDEALQVMSAWDFNYRSCAVWDKGTIGMGYWFRIQHELLLVGIRGNFSPPAPTDRISSVIKEPRCGHSEKPKVIYSVIEKMFPNAKKIELFARGKIDGWEAWGNET